MDKLLVGFYNMDLGQIIMILIGGLLIYLAIKKYYCYYNIEVDYEYFNYRR